MRIPDKSFEIFNLLCKKAVSIPKRAPTRKDNIRAKTIEFVFIRIIPPREAPTINEPSGVKSGKPNTRNEKTTDKANKEYTIPIVNANIINSMSYLITSC